MDLGDTLRGRERPAPGTVSANQLIAEYAAACAHRPPGNVLGHLGREARKLLEEGIAPAHVRAGLDLHRASACTPARCRASCTKP